MIIGIGTDIVKIKRIKNLIDYNAKSFITRCFTKKEQENEKGERKNYYAKRWAAKEAIVKALGTGFKEIKFTDIEITNDNNGKPIAHCNKLSKIVQNDNVSIHISISDEKEYAIAFAVIYASTTMKTDNHQ